MILGTCYNVSTLRKGTTKDLSEVNIVLVRGGPGVSLRKAGSPQLCKKGKYYPVL